MSAEMLTATQQAAWAAQSAAEAAWWGLLINGLVVAVAVGATAFQDHRVTARLNDQTKARDDRAKVVLQRAHVALTAAAPIFYAADDTMGPQNLDALLEDIQRARALVAVYQSSDIDVRFLAALIKAEAALHASADILQQAKDERSNGVYANGRHNGQIDWRAGDLKKDIDALG